MLITCWSVKGGSGTTVVAAALALLLARRCDEGALVVDAGGDIPVTLGLAETRAPGLSDWLAAGPEVGAEALARLEVDAVSGLRVLSWGSSAGVATGSPFGGPPAGPAGSRLLEALSERAAGGFPVVVDAGPISPLALELAAGATVSLLVLRPCYLAIRRALASPVRPSAVVLVDEPERSLRAADIEDVLGVPVRAVVPYDPAIARCVDAGLLASRLPRPLATALRATA